ncbi:12670_t:CDS:1, partial [Acaulospora morrowiae]
LQNKHDGSTAHVSSLLDQLRHETRSKSKISAGIFPLLPLPSCNYLMNELATLEQNTQGEFEMERQHVPGPAPPKSWQRSRYLEAGRNTAGIVFPKEIKVRKIKKGAWDGERNLPGLVIIPYSSSYMDTIFR